MGKTSEGKRWTKKDIRTLQDQLMSFVLQYELYVDPGTLLTALERDRLTIVLNGLRGFRSLLVDRLTQYGQTADHFETHPAIYGEATREMVERFRSYHRETARDLGKLDRLIARVEAEGLPPEVSSHMPDRHGLR